MKHRLRRLWALVLVCVVASASWLAYAEPAWAPWRPGSDDIQALNDLQFCTNGARFQLAGSQVTPFSALNSMDEVPPADGPVVAAVGLLLPFNPIEIPGYIPPSGQRDYSGTFTVRWVPRLEAGSFVWINFEFGEAFAYALQIDPCIFTPIEIQPGHSASGVRPRGQGRIAVALLTTASFHAAGVKAKTVRFGAVGDEATPAGKRKLRDVNGDGKKDLVLRFRIKHTGISCTSTDAAVTGTTPDGQAFVGSDAIRTRGCD